MNPDWLSSWLGGFDNTVVREGEFRRVPLDNTVVREGEFRRRLPLDNTVVREGEFRRRLPLDNTVVREGEFRRRLPPSLPRVPKLEDFQPGTGAVFSEAVRHRPVPLLMKALVAAGLPEVKIALPLGDGVVTRKTPNERLKFELGLSRQAVQGRMFDDAMAQYLAAKKSGVR